MTRRPRIAGPGRPRLAVPVALLAAALMLSVPGIAGPPSRAGAAATPTVSALRIPSAPLRDAPSAAPTPGEAARVTPGVTPGVPPSFQWFNLTPYSSPPGRYGAAMTYDLEDQYVLLFGGESAATATPLGDTWSYVSGDWKEICPGNFGGSACDDGPPPSSDSSMAYDPNSSEVVDYDFARALTFGFAQGVWVNLTGPERPPAQQFPSGIAYDPVDGRMLILSASGVTFELDGPNWTEAPVTGAHPSARTGAVLFSDTLLGKVVLSGGVEGSQPLTDTWEFGNGTWQAVATASSPPGSEAAAFDETYEDGAVLAEAPGSDTLVLWGFSASGWSRVAEVGSTAPTPSGEPSLTFDAHDGYLLLYWG
ncbi:MAG: kelch repeat-containing protein, partial [Thermoplasmata archaeon]